MTPTVAAVLAVMRDGNEHYGRALIRVTGIPPGSLYPILTRLKKAGLAEGRDEGIAIGRARSPRHYLKLTPAGVELVPQALARLHAGANAILNEGLNAPCAVPRLGGILAGW